MKWSTFKLHWEKKHIDFFYKKKLVPKEIE